MDFCDDNLDNHLRLIAEHVATPCYAYDMARLEFQLETLKKYFPKAAIFYALKANSNPHILRYFQSQKLGAEVISCGEIAYAHHAEMPLLIGGPRQDAAMIDLAQQSNISYVSLDSASQWENWQAHSEPRKRSFLIRLNPQLDPHTHPHLATGAADSKFGLPLEQVRDLAMQLGEHLCGFHVHAGSQIHDISIYDAILQQLSTLYTEFPQARVLDMGGGFAVPAFDMQAFATKITDFTEAYQLELVLEPGRFLVAEAGVLLTRVLHRKLTGKTHIICDASMADLLRPALYQAEHPIRSLKTQPSTTQEVVEVQGCLCENSDRLGISRSLPVLNKGDLLVIALAGAYGMSMSSQYAGSIQPAEVIFDSRLEVDTANITYVRKPEMVKLESIQSADSRCE